MAKKANAKEKDANLKKKNDAMIGLLCACSYDKDGNEIPMDQRLEKMKGMMSEEQFESFKKEMNEAYEKNKDSQEFKDAMQKAKANVKPEDYDKMIEDAKAQAKTTLSTIEKEKAEIEEYEKKLNEIEDKLKDATGDEKKKLEQKQQQLQQNPPQSTLATATGVDTTTTTTPTGEPDPKPKEKTAEEIKAEHDKIEKDYKEKSKKLEDEYQAKIDAEKDEAKKKELEEEWEKKEKELTAAKNKAMDAIDDNDEHDTENDETKKGKYKVKEEEITDPKTGEKKKVKTYTGPRGGKFYYPDGSPHTPEHKVYVESMSLVDYLLESLK
jgi:colicin import membrane protein